MKREIWYNLDSLISVFMPEQSEYLEIILTEALKKAGEQGLLEGISDPELARLTINARTKAAVASTGVLSEGSEISKEQEMQEVIAAYEVWRQGGPKPEGVEAEFKDYPFCYLKSRVSEHACWVLPDVGALGDQFSSNLLHYFEVPNDLRPLGVKKLKLVKPAFLRDKNNRSIGVTMGELGRG